MNNAIASSRLRLRAAYVTVGYAPELVMSANGPDVHVGPVRYLFKVAKVLNRRAGAVTLFPAPSRPVEPIEF